MEDLQSLLEKINRDGVEKAETEAARIVDEAKARAKAIVAEAEAAAARAKAEAEKSAADYASRAAETVAQAARDTVLGVEKSVTALVESLLVKSVDRALGDEKTVADLAATAVSELAGKGEVTCAPKLAKALVAALAARGEFTVRPDESLAAGFTVRLDGGRIEHSFTSETIASELARRLRPDLAKLVR